MKIVKRETVFKGKFLKVTAKHFENDEGKKGVWECVEKKKKAVIIFALTKQKEVILAKTYRFPVEGYVLELPAGLCDKQGETEKQTAKRELREETGYEAKEIFPIFKTTGDMSLTDMDLIYFFAPDIEFKGKTATDDAEDIEVVKVPVDKLVDTALNPPKGLKICFTLLSSVPVLRSKGLI